eukprot:jgi/Chlat1/3424/Chrsp23S00274
MAAASGRRLAVQLIGVLELPWCTRSFAAASTSASSATTSSTRAPSASHLRKQRKLQSQSEQAMAEYRKALADVRRKYQQQVEADRQAKEQAVKQEQERIQAAKAERLAQKRILSQQRQAAAAERQQQLRAAMDERALYNRFRLQARQTALAERKDIQVEKLLSQSRNWITMDSLDSAIEQALDDPMPLRLYGNAPV